MSHSLTHVGDTPDPSRSPTRDSGENDHMEVRRGGCSTDAGHGTGSTGVSGPRTSRMT